MKRFSKAQIVAILKEYEFGKNPKAICCEHGISSTTFYRWRNKYMVPLRSPREQAKQIEEMLIQNLRAQATPTSTIRVIRHLN
jgi:transposase-like protein